MNHEHEEYSSSPYSKPYPRRPPPTSSRPGDERAYHLRLAEYRNDNGEHHGSLISGPRQAVYSDYPSSSLRPREAPESRFHHDVCYYHEDRGGGEEYHRDEALATNAVDVGREEPKDYTGHGEGSLRRSSVKENDKADTINKMDIDMIPRITLSNGIQMPQLAFGTAPRARPGELPSSCNNPNFVGFLPEQVPRSLHLALQTGIHHIDTALIYRSHGHIAHVLQRWFMEGRLKREDVFITSKIYHPPSRTGMESTTIDIDNLSVREVEKKVHDQFQQSLIELGVGYVDLMLLHWPSSGDAAGQSKDGHNNMSNAVTMAEIDPIKAAKRIAAWKVLEHYYNIGWARAIGVSNFHEEHLQHLMDDGATIKPHVNQIETNVYTQQENIIQYCEDNGIAVMAFSPFGRGVMNMETDDVLTLIGLKHNMSPGQIALAYLLRRGFAVSFSSSSQERMRGNINACSIALDDDDMESLKSLQRSGSQGLRSPYSLS